MNKFFVCCVGDPFDMRLTGERFFCQVRNEQEARTKYLQKHPRHPAALIVVKEVDEQTARKFGVTK